MMLGLGAVAAAAATSAMAMALFGSGTAAAAPDVVGQPYSDAVDEIESGGGSAVVATRVGDKLDQGDCIVTNAWDQSFLRIDSSASHVSVALNCAGEYATATNPGASVASPLGRVAKSKAEEEAENAEEQELAEVSTPDY
ncbi:hypothetical protein [Mycolicibacterium phlei]